MVKGNLRPFTAFHRLSRFLQYLPLYGRGIPHSLPPLEEAFHIPPFGRGIRTSLLWKRDSHIPSPFGGGRERERHLHRDMLDYVPTLY